MSDSIVAKRYARALFEVAKEQQAVAQVDDELTAVVAAIKANAEFEKLLQHPNFDTANKIDLLRTVFEGKLSDAVFQTLALLIERGRESMFGDLRDAYLAIADQELGQAKAIVTTPAPLSAEETKEIASHFGKLTGKTIRVENVVDKSLIGGMTVRIGDRLYDGSLSGKLARMQKSLLVSQAF